MACEGTTTTKKTTFKLVTQEKQTLFVLSSHKRKDLWQQLVPEDQFNNKPDTQSTVHVTVQRSRANMMDFTAKCEKVLVISKGTSVPFWFSAYAGEAQLGLCSPDTAGRDLPSTTIP